MKVIEFYKKKDFENYLDNLKSKNTDYINYVENSHKILNNNLFETIKKIVETEDYAKLDIFRNEGIFIIKKSDKVSKKQYISGFNKYLDFIESYITNINLSETIEIDNLEELEGIILPDYSDDTHQLHVFDKENLINIFQFRLISQNRFNKSGIYFPISFLKQIFYKIDESKYFDSIILKQIEKIKYYSDGVLNSFNSIDRLEIKSSGDVFVNGNIMQSECFKDKTLKLLKAYQLSSITLDHTKSMDSILKDFGDVFKDSQLYEISKSIKKGLHKPLTYNKLKKRGAILSNDHSFMSSIVVDKLKKEFEFICNQMELILMQAEHNNFKRAR